MGLILSRLFGNLGELLKTRRHARILMLGLDNAGKTTILYKLRLGETINTIPTIGFQVEEVEYKNLNFTIFDVGGQWKIRKLWKHYYEGTDALIYVVDSADSSRIEEAQDELMGILQNDSMRDVSLLVLANKQDCATALKGTEIAKSLGLDGLRIDWYIQPSSAKNGEGLYEGLDWVAERILRKSRR